MKNATHTERRRHDDAQPVFFRVSKQTHQQIKFLALIQNRPASALMRDAIADYFVKHDIKEAV